MNLKTRYIIAVVAVLFGLVFLLGYQKGKGKLPTKVDTTIETNLRAEIKELTNKLTESQLNYQKLKSEEKNKTKVTYQNADGSSYTKEMENSMTVEAVTYELQQKITEQGQIITNLQEEVKSKQVIKNSCSAVFFGPGVTSKIKPMGMIGAHGDNHGISVTSDGDLDHSAYYNFVLTFN